MNLCKKGLIIFLIMLCFISCNSGSSDENTTKDTAIKASQSNTQGPSPDIEAAETIVAGYYSDLNRKAGYPLYKGLELKILKIYQDSSGQQMIDSDITGRKRNTTGADTSTLAFKELISVRAKWLNNRWQPDTAIVIVP